MGAAAILVTWTVIAGSQYQVCYQRPGVPQACIADNTGRVRFELAEDTDYSFTYRRDGIESPPLSFHTERAKAALPAPCPTVGPTLPPAGCGDVQSLVLRLRAACGKKCRAVR